MRGGWAQRAPWTRRLELPQGQQQLVLAARNAIGPHAPLVGLLVHGGSFAFGPGVLEALDAVVDAWQPGVGGAAAIARVLFGDVSPAGRTPQTWYASNGELPPPGTMSLYPNATANSSGLTYRHYTGAPVFAFGHGLSYTSFGYTGLDVNASAAAPCEPIGVQVDVANTGGVACDEVVQLYVSTPDATVPAPRRRLAAFARVHLAAGARTTVRLAVAAEARAVMSAAGAIATGDAIYAASSEQVLEPGRLVLHVGGGQPDAAPTLNATVAIQGTTTKLLACK